VPITNYFNNFFIWFFFYGLHWTVISIIILIRKGDVPPSFSFVFPLGHFFALVALAYGTLIGLSLLRVGVNKSLFIIFLYSAVAVTGLILNIFSPYKILSKGYAYDFINANNLVEILWALPVMSAILFLAVIFWWQAVKNLTDSPVRQKNIFFAIVFSIIVLVVPTRNIFEGFYFALISEILLTIAVLIATISFFILKEKH